MRHIPKDTLPRSHVIVASHDTKGFREALNYNTVSYVEGAGVYTMRDGPDAGKGVAEFCFIFDKAFLSLLCSGTPFLDEQESVLVLEPYDHALNGNPATLHYINGYDKPDEALGVFRSVPESLAINAGNYTFAGGEFFTCLPEHIAREIGHRLFTRAEVEEGRVFDPHGGHWPQPSADVNATADEPQTGRYDPATPSQVVKDAGEPLDPIKAASDIEARWTAKRTLGDWLGGF